MSPFIDRWYPTAKPVIPHDPKETKRSTMTTCWPASRWTRKVIIHEACMCMWPDQTTETVVWLQWWHLVQVSYCQQAIVTSWSPALCEAYYDQYSLELKSPMRFNFVNFSTSVYKIVLLEFLVTAHMVVPVWTVWGFVSLLCQCSGVYHVHYFLMNLCVMPVSCCFADRGCGQWPWHGSSIQHLAGTCWFPFCTNVTVNLVPWGQLFMAVSTLYWSCNY